MNINNIEYRGYSKKIKKWIHGYYVKHETRVPGLNGHLREDETQHLIFKTEMTDWDLPTKLSAYEVEKDSINLFSGVRDIDSVKIYDGDYLYIHEGNNRVTLDEYYKVSFENGNFRAISLSVDCSVDLFFTVEKCKSPKTIVKVIGNCYETPENEFITRIKKTLSNPILKEKPWEVAK